MVSRIEREYLYKLGGVKIFYALMAAKLTPLAWISGFGDAARKTAGGIMPGAGSYLIVKT